MALPSEPVFTYSQFTHPSDDPATLVAGFAGSLWRSIQVHHGR
jgi:hypothetical protein